MVGQFNKVEELSIALIYLRHRESQLMSVYNTLFDASNVTGMGSVCLGKLKVELGDIIDTIFILERYQDMLKENDKDE